MTATELAKALGGSFNGKWINIPGPGHGCGDTSLGFCFEPNQPSGIRIHSFAGDDPAICRQHVINRLKSLSGGALPVIEQKAHPALEQADTATTTKALSVWHAAVGVANTPVETYLAARGCLPAPAISLTGVLRFHPKCPMGGQKVPAMVSLMRDALTGEPTGIHRTALADDGSAKRVMPNGMPAKMMFGRAKGAVAMLNNSASVMGIAEGIETAFSAQKLFEIPVWACMSAQGIAGFPAIHGLDHLIVFADHDKAGIVAAQTCAARMVSAGIKGAIKYPSKRGDDWNCYLQKGTNSVK